MGLLICVFFSVLGATWEYRNSDKFIEFRFLSLIRKEIGRLWLLLLLIDIHSVGELVLQVHHHLLGKSLNHFVLLLILFFLLIGIVVLFVRHVPLWLRHKWIEVLIVLVMLWLQLHRHLLLHLLVGHKLLVGNERLDTVVLHEVLSPLVWRCLSVILGSLALLVVVLH